MLEGNKYKTTISDIPRVLKHHLTAQLFRLRWNSMYFHRLVVNPRLKCQLFFSKMVLHYFAKQISKRLTSLLY
jgi:hypothetical protein